MTAPLGNIANKVTPPDHREGVSSPQAVRALKFRLRETAGRLLPSRSLLGADGVVREVAHRVARCGRSVIGGQVTIIAWEGGARFHGVETCGSVWLCPVCSAKIAEHRRGEIEAMLDAHIAGRRRRPVLTADSWAMATWETVQAAPGAVYMLTVTVPHRAWDSLAVMREVVTDCWTRVVRGAPWDRWKAKAGIVGVIRAMEVTYGRNGWHPHLHVLVLAADLAPELEAEFSAWLAERWARFVAKAGLGEVNHHGVEWHRAEKIATAGDYLVKWGCDAEIAKWATKRSAGKSRSPWQLLADAAEGDAEARMRWREFAEVFAGTRHITMSHGLRDLYLEGREISDDEICALDHGIDPAELVAMTGETVVGAFRRSVWVRMVKAGVLADILDAAEAGGWPAVLDFLRTRNLSVGGHHGRHGKG